jgi:histidyl-tRNA synthetase
LRADRAFDDRSMKSQLKSADRSGAAVALIVGPDEKAGGTVTLRPLRGTGEQRSVPRAAVVEAVRGQAGHDGGRSTS